MTLDLELNEDQKEIEALFDHFFENESTPEVIRRAEPLGFDAELWSLACEIGAPGMAVPDPEHGGGRFSDLVVACECLGRRVAPIPLVEHFVASRLLSAPEVLDGSRIVTLSLRPTNEDGLWEWVPAGAIADTVIGLDGDELIAASSKPPGQAPVNHGSAPLADRSARSADREVIGTREDFERALDHWRLLTAAALVGISTTAQEIALRYLMERKAFGRPIGAFQVLQHGMADFPAWIDGGRTLIHKAAWALDNGRAGNIDRHDFEIEDPAALISMAYSFACEAAAGTTDRSLHYHGSYGFSLEYDIQLYYRRARGWPLQLGDPAAERQRLAGMLWPLEKD
jgi:alkylation response protein AidB-like acyl-CoA dehydrogenase